MQKIILIYILICWIISFLILRKKDPGKLVEEVKNDLIKDGDIEVTVIDGKTITHTKTHKGEHMELMFKYPELYRTLAKYTVIGVCLLISPFIPILFVIKMLLNVNKKIKAMYSGK
jgi:hypothetical protein